MLGQAAGDLVEQEELRLRRERARELEPLAVEQREPPGERVRVPPEPGAVEHLDARALAASSGIAAPNVAATSRFSNTVMPPNGCGIW